MLQKKPKRTESKYDRGDKSVSLTESVLSSQNSDSSDSSSKSLAGRTSQQISSGGKAAAAKEGQIKQTDIIELIEKNEKQNEACPEKLIE